jgi:hypothetical protein
VATTAVTIGRWPYPLTKARSPCVWRIDTGGSMQCNAVLALATTPRSFTASNVARQVQRLGGVAASAYAPRLPLEEAQGKHLVLGLTASGDTKLHPLVSRCWRQ